MQLPIFSNYIHEDSNSRHPGIILMQSGSQKPYPLSDFVSNCNNAVDLTNIHGDFYNVLSTACETVDEINDFISNCAKFRGQSGDGTLLSLRKQFQPIYVMDKKYFMDKFNSIIEKTAPGSNFRETGIKKIYTEFSTTLKYIIKTNISNIEKLNRTTAH